MYICICNAITESQVQSAVADGVNTMADLQAQLGVATSCGCCHDTATDYLPGGRYANNLPAPEVDSVIDNAANDARLPAQTGFTEVIARRA